MDLLVKKGDLLKELQYVQGVVEKKTTVPILANILLQTSGNRLSVTATDLDVTIRCSCPADVKVSGALTLSARKLFDIVRLLPDQEIHFKTSGQEWVQLTCARSRFKIASLPKENFPDVPEVESAPIRLPAPTLRHMIASCIFAITQEESRFALNGALLLLQPGEITLVTTDGHRLALISREAEIEGVEDEVRVLIPRKTLAELSKLATEGGAVEFGKSQNQLFFRVGERLLVSRILSGQFPNYEMVIPKDNEIEVPLSTEVFTDALRRVSVMADEQSRSVRFSLQEGQLDIASNSSDYGEATESIPVEFSDEPIKICFNAGYLLDFLTGLQSEEVLLFLKDNENQGLFSPKDTGGYDYKYVVMPMKM